MAKQVDVLVKDISVDEHGRPTPTHGNQTTLSYKSFLIVNDPGSPRYELLGEIDPIGLNPDGSYKLVPGSPNLNAQHRTAQPQKPSAVPVVNAGPSEREKALEAEIARLKAQQSAPVPVVPAIPDRKKPGPKSKKALEGANA